MYACGYVSVDPLPYMCHVSVYNVDPFPIGASMARVFQRGQKGSNFNDYVIL